MNDYRLLEPISAKAANPAAPGIFTMPAQTVPPVPRKRADDSVIKTAKRIFEILEYFEEVQTPLSLKALTERFDYPASSASVLLKSMVTLGYLEYDRYSRSYMPTMRMSSLNDWVKKALFGEGQTLRLMRHIHTLTGETITLGTQSDLYAQYIHVIPSDTAMQHAIKPGDVRYLSRSGLGWLLLGARDDKTVDILLRRINARECNATHRVNIPTLQDRIRQIRKAGHVYSQHTVVRGGGMIGMLLPTPQWGRIHAIGVNGTVENLEKKHDLIIDVLRDSISRFTSETFDAL